MSEAGFYACLLGLMYSPLIVVLIWVALGMHKQPHDEDHA